MKQIEFNIEINTTPSKVWKALWENENYKKWTTVFCEGSYAESDWKEGSKILFLIPSGDGMYSKIETLIPNHKMYFVHLGEMKNFEEQPQTEITQEWSGARENYTLLEQNNFTLLNVTMDIVESHLEYFQTSFPKALEMVKKIAEEN
jgi:uncharacterized protein YndB with AHSA1/START domain